MTTLDGYILTLHRIPGPKGTTFVNGIKKQKPTVLLLHGLFMNAMGWIDSGPDGNGKAIPYQLVDTEKYDVWLMNARGIIYSREHTWLSPDSSALFWNFSFEEFAKFDLKASIEFIQNEKNSKEKITLIGYSQGTTTTFYAMAEDSAFFKSKINIFIGLAPTIYFANAKEERIQILSKQTALYEYLVS